MTLFLDRIDAAPILSDVFEPPFASWITILVNVLNEDIQDIENALNFFIAPNLALLSETVTLTLGLPTFTVANGSIYRVGSIVIGTGIPVNTQILSIVGNTITLTANATSGGSSTLTFVPVGTTINNGSFLYDTTNNVYVGMQNNSLVKFTTTSYP